MLVALIDKLEISDGAIEAAKAKLEQNGHSLVVFNSRTTNEGELVSRAENAEAVIFANIPFRESVISRLPKLKMISVAFTGTDLVDVAYCHAHGITVCNASGYSTVPVAELALGMAISALRDFVLSDAATRLSEGRDGRVGQDLRGKTVGIIGTGAIGCYTAQIFKAMGCEVLGFSRTERPDFPGVYAPLDEVLHGSDIVSIHLPLTPVTRGLIGAMELATMKPDAILINTARGPIVDQEALAAALHAGHLAHAAIDVFDIEPPLAQDHPMLGAPRTSLTPHIAYATKQAFERRVEIVVENVVMFANNDPVNVV
ncbi:D-isomer specific 2-hydroxyacid dehydrogenase, NAD binding domain [Carpediemonas membranifera]|uniref:D-isomer specific 2-hydroxyacid dehydrogenase, NAD binding domain n=1 Tax=Carpediemonas membranifera TaxID=201153 RepID=A0A8J6AWY7_9EUKA|nr:D-isomer specific 2-hydroxyacid dehydrogenase, NAD binding domain [Carpediemonas membranifera]|eukprot:KAG9390393.1 D-isomer specific 2-hydroxyacid dehydrogenase, NAD binding domain [Carpediemonas membranifera]